MSYFNYPDLTLSGDTEISRHTPSRYSRIAVIRESDLPFATKDADEKNNIIVSSSHGNKFTMFSKIKNKLQQYI